jgi:hypothetical protein
MKFNKTMLIKIYNKFILMNLNFKKKKLKNIKALGVDGPTRLYLKK